MNVHGWQRRLDELGSRLRQAPVAVERRAGEEALSKVPPGTSVRVTRTPSGASAAFSGPHAAAAAKNMRARMRPSEAVRGLLRGGG